MNDLKEQKQSARKFYLSMREKFSRHRYASEIQKRVNVNVVEWLVSQDVKTLGFYMSTQNEVSVSMSVTHWLSISEEHIAYLPICKNKNLIFAEWTPYTGMALSSFNICEPISNKFGTPSFYLVPCIAINKQGYRLGYGGGYYDRYFKKLQDSGINFVAIGVCLHYFSNGDFAAEPQDIPLNYLISEEGFKKFEPIEK